VKPRIFGYERGALTDLAEIWERVALRDGEERADRLRSRIEAFCRSLAVVPNIGTRHPDRFPGLRSTGVPGLKFVAVLFVTTPSRVTVVRIGYLGRNVWAEIPSPANDT